MKLKALLPAFLLYLCCLSSAAATELSVFAASSLTEALREVTQTYERQHPEDRVLLNFAGSQTLAMQIEQGAPADLFISANKTVMTRLQRSSLVSEAQPLLGNRLAVATRSDLQPALSSIFDLSRPRLLLVIGNPQVPVGHYTRQLFANLVEAPGYGAELVAQIKGNIVSEESRVKAIVAKLLLGEADAGIIYQSDLGKDKLPSVQLPDGLNPRVIYPLAKVHGGANQSERFYLFLLSDAAAEIFRRHGFLSGSEL